MTLEGNNSDTRRATRLKLLLALARICERKQIMNLHIPCELELSFRFRNAGSCPPCEANKGRHRVFAARGRGERIYAAAIPPASNSLPPIGKSTQSHLEFLSVAARQRKAQSQRLRTQRR